MANPVQIEPPYPPPHVKRDYDRRSDSPAEKAKGNIGTKTMPPVKETPLAIKNPTSGR